MLPEILDVCCGSRMFYFNKSDQRVLFGDIRQEKTTLCDGRTLEIKPDIIFDFRRLPFRNESFSQVIFDPPHLDHAGPLSWQGKKFGVLDKRDWPKDLRKGFNECWRVLKPQGTLIFKWNETHIPLSKVLACFDQTPVCGHTTTHKLKTHWMLFFKGV